MKRKYNRRIIGLRKKLKKEHKMFGLNKYKNFWTWFTKNSDELFKLEDFNAAILDELGKALAT